jgi:hypothetical protein
MPQSTPPEPRSETDEARATREARAARTRVLDEAAAVADAINAAKDATKDAAYGPDLPHVAPKQFPTFAETAHDLIRYRAAFSDPMLCTYLDEVRDAFDDTINHVAPFMPASPDSTIAARKIHDACQAVIFAIVHARVP